MKRKRLVILNVCLWCAACRQCSFVRIFIGLVLILIGIQILHIVLASQLENKETTLSVLHQRDYDLLYESLMARLESHQVMDSSGQFIIVSNLVRPLLSSNLPVKTTLVTLVSQCSANHLYRLLNLVKFWQGPISVAVFTTETNFEATIDTILKLLICRVDIFNTVSVHLVFQLALPVKKRAVNPHSYFDEKLCNSIQEVLRSESLRSFQGNYAWAEVAYPTNLLRNVALDNAASDYVFAIDADMLPSHGLYSDLLGFIYNFSRSENERAGSTAFIVPAFEVRDSVSIPLNKENLTDLWQRKDVRPFYQASCWKCQEYTNYSAWKDLPSSNSLTVGYAAEWKDPWEPFYVVPKSAPRYDERFRQYGFNRISQSCELHIAGFNFLVLNNAYLIHCGFKTVQGFHEGKESEQAHNRLLYRKFKEELKIKYPASNRRCY